VGLGSPPRLKGAAVRSVAGRRIGIWVVRTDEEAVLFPWVVLPYCDDFLLIVKGSTAAERASRAAEAQRVVLAALECLGLTRQPDKGQWEPLEWIDHLGLHISTENGVGRVSVTPQRVGKIRSQAKTLVGRAMRQRRLVPARELAAFIGLVQSCYLAVPVAQLFCRELNNCLGEKDSWNGKVRLSRQAIRDLEWWVTMPMKWNGRRIHREAITRLLYTDASDFAWGARLYEGKLAELNAEEPGHFRGPTAQGALSAEQQKDGIMVNEMRAAIWAVEAFLPALKNCSIRMMQDNQAVLFSVRKLASKQPLVMKLVRRFWALCDLHSISVKMDYVRSAFNEADAPSRKKFPDEWGLDARVFALVESELRVQHSLDLFASRLFHQTRRYVSRMPDGLSVGVDAFALRSWGREVSWINADWDLLPQIAQRLEMEPAAAATVVCPYNPADLGFTRLRRLSSKIVVLPFDQAWVCRPPKHEFGRLGPARWSVAFVHIPARQGGESLSSKRGLPAVDVWMPRV